jgi:hypothetical protein
MRTIVVNLLTACFGTAALFAGRLDVAVVQFPEEKAPAELEQALVNANLFQMTNADRTRTAHPFLKGGSVLSHGVFSPCPDRSSQPRRV